MARLILRGGRVIDPAAGRDEVADVVIEAGRVAEVGRGLAPAEGDRARVVDVSGLLVLPGLVDPHVHLRVPGEERKETLASGTAAAAAGGFTSVAAMPNTRPPVDSPERVQWLLDRCREQAVVRVHPIAAVTVGQEGERLAPLGGLAEAGAVAFSDDGRPVADAELMRRALSFGRALRRPVISHAEEPSLSAGGSANLGAPALRLGLRGIPWASEAVAVARDTILAGATGGRLHVAHVSTEVAVEVIAWGRRRGWPVTCEVTPHHLLLSDEALLERPFDTATKVNPPLRGEADRRALVDALAAGEIDCIATDHAPHHAEDKLTDYASAAFGISGLETAFALLYTGLCLPGRMPLADLVRRMTVEPARVLGLPYGTLLPGAPADVACVDPDAEWVVEPERFRSRGRNTPFAGWRVHGRVVLTLVEGRAVHDERGALAEVGSGGR